MRLQFALPGIAALLLVAAPLAGAATNVVVDTDAALRQLRHTPGNPVFLDQLRAGFPTMTNARQREVALAVYGLGCLINGEPDKAQLARDALARQFPGSASLALFKADPLMTPCPRCGGEGDAQREFCPTCKGGRRCQACGGKGKLKNLSSGATCSGCSGTGRCRECEGTGRKKSACARCGGQGRVYDLEEIRRTSFGLIQQYLNPDGVNREPAVAPGERRARRNAN